MPPKIYMVISEIDCEGNQADSVRLFSTLKAALEYSMQKNAEDEAYANDQREASGFGIRLAHFSVWECPIDAQELDPIEIK